jgi:hypothetical protein
VSASEAGRLSKRRYFRHQAHQQAEEVCVCVWGGDGCAGWLPRMLGWRRCAQRGAPAARGCSLAHGVPAAGACRSSHATHPCVQLRAAADASGEVQYFQASACGTTGSCLPVWYRPPPQGRLTPTRVLTSLPCCCRTSVPQENPRIPYRGAKIMSSQPQFLRDFATGLNTTMFS